MLPAFGKKEKYFALPDHQGTKNWVLVFILIKEKKCYERKLAITVSF